MKTLLGTLEENQKEHKRLATVTTVAINFSLCPTYSWWRVGGWQLMMILLAL